MTHTQTTHGQTNYRSVVAWLIAGWSIFAVTASSFHLYQTAPGQPPIALLLAVLVPISIFTIWYLTSKPFREFVLSIDPRTLSTIHSFRWAGFVFVVLYAYGILPGLFALPAGLGDMAIGLTALPVGARLAAQRSRSGFIRWNLFGVADLVNALSLGAAVGILEPNGIPTAPMTVLPMSFIPTFGVPLFLIIHIISIAQARRWPAENYSGVTKQPGLSAA
ncbi:hypothetical protein [Edaphobacter bradus]|uniref:hypothetical protein n=1 Tax=Edaphobacter bradus TaxID=2259016 RepID=UPI0021DF9BD6|nr:hypothetical protein [Edaphobacter bradus]